MSARLYFDWNATAPPRPEAKQAAIEALGELAVGRLSRHDRDQVVGDLRALAPADGPDGPDRFASELVTLLVSPDAEAQLRPGDWAERGGPRRLIRRLLPDALERWLIRIGLFLAFLSALLGALVLAVVVSGQITAIEVPPGPMEMPTEPIWVGILAVVWVVVGLACGWALVLSLARRHERAMGIARYAILLSLVAGGLLNLYISQLGALSDVIVQFVLLLLILDQRTRLSVQPQSQAAAGSGAA